MEHQEKYNFTWHSYSDHLRVMMKEMMTSGDFADVTLVCDDKIKIRVHKNILAACSPVFKDIFQIENSSIIYLKGINSSEMESILEFIYLGEATAYQEQIENILDVARSLEIKGLNSNERISKEKNADDDLISLTKYLSKVNGRSNAAEALKENFVNAEGYLEIKNEYLSGDDEHLDQTRKQKSLKINNDRQYTCNECDKVFCGQSGLYQHKKHVHEGVTYDCNQCDLKASKKSHLQRHFKKKHSM